MEEGAFDCSICQDKLAEAMETKCCHHCYCKQCIEDWLTRKNSCPSCRQTLTRLDLVPNVPIQRLIDSLPGECPYIKRGCNAKLTRGNVKAHITSCDYVEVPCVNQCGITVYKKDLVTHQRQTCAKRLMPCIQCTLMVSLDGIPEHISTSCPKTRITCVHCKVLLIREKLHHHHQRECNKIELTCPFTQFGCQFKGLRPEYNAHMIEDSDLHVGIVIEREAKLTEEIGKLKNELERGNKPKQQDNAWGFKPVFQPSPFGQVSQQPFIFGGQPAQQPPPFSQGQPPSSLPFVFGAQPPKPAQEPQAQPFQFHFAAPNNSGNNNRNNNGNNLGSSFVFK